MRNGEAGLALVSVLALLGTAAALVHLMLVPGDASLARSQRFSEAGQAMALVRAGENSAIAALRRDMVEAPEVDHPAEAWAGIAQERVEIAGGAFELAISDARDRVNLNALDTADVEGLRLLMDLAAAAGLKPEQAAAIAAVLEAEGPSETLASLGPPARLAPEEIAALDRVAATLPGRNVVNINTAPAAVIAAILQDPARARALVSRRDHAGYLRQEDVAGLGIDLPSALGPRSDLFRVRVRVRVGETEQAVESLLHRRSGETGPEVVVVSRRASAGKDPLAP